MFHAIVDQIRHTTTQRNSWATLAKIKEGELDGVDCQPGLSAEECREMASLWDERLKKAREADRKVQKAANYLNQL